MPKNTKKLLVYLDQNFISEMSKADVNNRVKPEFKELYQLLHEGFIDEKLVVPASWFHGVETSLAPNLKERIVSYQNYLGQVDLHFPDHVRNYQIEQYLQDFLGKTDANPFAIKIAFRDDPDKRTKMFNVTVDSHLERLDYKSGRLKTAQTLEEIRQGIVAKKVKYEEQMEKELAAQKGYFLSTALMRSGHVCTHPQKELVEFANAPVFRAIPVISIYSRLWSAVLTRFPERPIKPSDPTDIDVLSTYLPYVDVIGTDAFMAGQVKSLSIDREFNVRVYSAKTASLHSFRDFVETYVRDTASVNRPVLSVFVLAAPSVKEQAFKFFYALGMSSGEFREPEWVDIYGFDDGSMPRYQLRQGPQLEVPFYGLQEVHSLKVTPGTTHEEILSICRNYCKADKFLLIDHYQKLPKHFLLGVAMACDAGADTIFGYRIYNKKA